MLSCSMFILAKFHFSLFPLQWSRSFQIRYFWTSLIWISYIFVHHYSIKLTFWSLFLRRKVTRHQKVLLIDKMKTYLKFFFINNHWKMSKIWTSKDRTRKRTSGWIIGSKIIEEYWIVILYNCYGTSAIRWPWTVAPPSPLTLLWRPWRRPTRAPPRTPFSPSLRPRESIRLIPYVTFVLLVYTYATYSSQTSI